jgi:hypothetical protein
MMTGTGEWRARDRLAVLRIYQGTVDVASIRSWLRDPIP